MVSPWATSARAAIASRLAACLLLPALCLLATGCNNGRQLQTDLYQRELRLQEDEIYRLEDYIEEYQAIIRGYRCEVAELRRELEDSQAEVPPEEVTPIESTLPSPAGDDEMIDDPIEMLMDPPAEAGPKLEPTPAPDSDGDEVAPSFEPAPIFESSSVSEDDAASVSTAAHESEPSPPAPFPHAAGEAVSLRLTNGPPQGAETTLNVRVTESVPAALDGFDGKVSLMLTDSTLEGRSRRLALWDFSAEEVRDAWDTGPDGDPSLELPIRLPQGAPVGRPLRVWARLIDASGRKTLRSIEVEFTGDPPRLVEARQQATTWPRRLPIAAVEQAAPPNTASTLNWRRTGLGRFEDAAVRAASYHADSPRR